MPKLHDACQIFAEELLDRLGEFKEEEAPFALAIACHAVEEDLLHRHLDALTVIDHLWIVLEETIQRLRPDIDTIGSPGNISEDDMRLNDLCQYAVQISQELFPTL